MQILVSIRVNFLYINNEAYPFFLCISFEILATPLGVPPNFAKDYPEDFPLPSCLILGMVNENPIHVVVAQDEEGIVIISVYQPDLNKFEPDFRTRRK